MKIEKEIEVGINDTAVLEFRLSGIQHHIKKAVQMRAGGLCALIDEEVSKCFSEEKIKEAISEQVEREFENSMRYGDGARAVQKIVSEQVAKTIAKLSK